MRSALTASAACLLAWLCFPLLPAHARPDRPSPEKLASSIERYMTARAEHSRLSGTVLLARNGQILFCRGFGMANLEHDVPCGPNTKFRLGSITKQFTAMAVFVTIIERFPQEKLLIVVLSNVEGTRIGTIADDLAAITLGGPYVVPHEPKPAKVESAVLATYAGRYEPDRGEGKEKPPITVTAEGNQLRFEVKGQGRLVAVPETATQFYLKGADATVEFTRGSSGDVTHLTLLQNNQYLKAVKTGPPGSAPAAGQSRSEPAAKAVPQPVPGASSPAGAKP